MPTVVRLIAAATTRQRLNSVFVTYSTRSHDNPLGLFTVMILVCDFFEVIPAVWYRHGTKLCGELWKRRNASGTWTHVPAVKQGDSLK